LRSHSAFSTLRATLGIIAVGRFIAGIKTNLWNAAHQIKIRGSRDASLDLAPGPGSLVEMPLGHQCRFYSRYET
jgi:hypothetical protein